MKSVLNITFDRVFVINLDRRRDRMHSFNVHSIRSGIEKYERISAIDGRDLEFTNPLNLNHFSAGDVGCALSHRRVVSVAKKNNLESYVVFEDDVELRKGFNQLFPIFWQEVPLDWDLVYFGANHNNTNPVRVSDKVLKVNGSYTTHAMAVRNTIYEDLLKIWENPCKQVDVLLSEIHHKYNCYCFYPNLAGQKKGFSDILNKDVDYDFLLKL
jgi:GR25 family glycosyltransferase involved in LPS biosynthesis